MAVPDGLRDALAGRYAIERELGRGGMAVVYLARDLRYDRLVALKVLLGEHTHAGPERFEREIRFAARLQHPHILTVHDSGESPATGGAGPWLWYTMPFVEGESLRDRLGRERQLPVEDALRTATEAARALDYAHQHGVVHRDIKPGNILLTADGGTLVADFGVARALGPDEGLTSTGLAIGTPAYMSPEQASGDAALDGRSDQWSLAAVLYEMLAGEAPWTGPTAQAVVARRLSTPAPSVRALRPAVPAAVDDAIRKALAVVPADRFSTVAQFAQALHSSTASSPPIAAPAATRRLPPAAPTLTAALLLAAGLLFAWRRAAVPAPVDGDVRVIAVLPFDNLGDSADAYFVDGVADEVRTKIGQVAGLEVIARGSSLEYRHSAKRPVEIAGELGADYLLTGTVRWEKAGGGGASRVRVTPELVDARRGRAARSRWGRPFDASLTDVFQVQADIAARVAEALGVALADSTRSRLTDQPTGSLAAYDEFLKGEAAAQAVSVYDPVALRRAIGFYERAVAIDSAFAPAWARLSFARSRLYFLGVPDTALARGARLAAEHARRLRPDDPQVYRAFGVYYAWINPTDRDRSLLEFERGLALAPDNVDLLMGLGEIEPFLGRWDSAAVRLGRAALLDPRAANIFDLLSFVHLNLRRYDAADSAARQAAAVAPSNPAGVWDRVLVELGRGRLDSARVVMRAAGPGIDRAQLYRLLATYNDLYWALDDDAQRQVLGLPLDAYDGDRSAWAMVRAELHHLRGDRAQAAVYADSARLAFEEQLRATPGDAQRHALLGLVLAYLGRGADAVREGRRAVELRPVSRDAQSGPYMQLQLVRIHLLLGQTEQALDQLEPLLRIPFYLSPGWLRIDPNFDVLRSHPRFRKLVEGTA